MKSRRDLENFRPLDFCWTEGTNKPVAQALYIEFDFHSWWSINLDLNKIFRDKSHFRKTLEKKVITQCSVANICLRRFHPPLQFIRHIPLRSSRKGGWRFKSSGTSTLLSLPDHEDGSNMFLRNFNYLPVDEMSHLVTLQSSSTDLLPSLLIGHYQRGLTSKLYTQSLYPRFNLQVHPIVTSLISAHQQT